MENIFMGRRICNINEKILWNIGMVEKCNKNI